MLRKYHFLGICLVFTRSRQSISFTLKNLKRRIWDWPIFVRQLSHILANFFLLDHDILELLSHVVFMQISPQSQNGYKTNKTGHGCSPKIPLVSQWNVIRVQKSHYIFNARFPISTIWMSGHSGLHLSHYILGMVNQL